MEGPWIRRSEITFMLPCSKLIFIIMLLCRLFWNAFYIEVPISFEYHMECIFWNFFYIEVPLLNICSAQSKLFRSGNSYVLSEWAQTSNSQSCQRWGTIVMVVGTGSRVYCALAVGILIILHKRRLAAFHGITFLLPCRFMFADGPSC